MSETVCPPALDITQTFGTFVIGTILGTLFYGMTLLQTGLYFGKLREGSRWTTVLVVVLFVLDTMTWILEVYTTWWYFVINYANPAKLLVPIWALKLEPGFTYTVAFIAQLFFIEKIWLLSKSPLLGATLGFFALAAWLLGLTITGIVFHIDALNSPTIEKVNIGQKTLSTVVEIVIGVGMCLLLKSRQRGGVRSTNSILNRLIVFALSRGLVLGLTQVLYTIVFFALPNALIWSIFHFSLSKLSSNSVLASLNVRGLMRNGTSAQSNGSGNNFNSLSLRPFTQAQTVSGAHQAHIVLPIGGDRKTDTQDKEAQGTRITVGTEFYKHVDGSEVVE